MGFHGARRVALAAVLALGATGAGAEPVCSEGAVFLRTPGGTEMRFSVEIADDTAERSLGLMNREHMARSSGMLFLYPKPQRAGFWMKDTLIPLDMIFMDQTGRVTKVHNQAVPLDRSGIDGGKGVKFVLEINGGLAKTLGIVPGSALLHPAVDQGLALWPCPAP